MPLKTDKVVILYLGPLRVALGNLLPLVVPDTVTRYHFTKIVGMSTECEQINGDGIVINTSNICVYICQEKALGCLEHICVFTTSVEY